MNIKEKMEQAMKMINEVIEESSQMTDTETNQKISSLIRSFGKDVFIGHLEAMQSWVNDMDINKNKTND